MKNLNINNRLRLNLVSSRPNISYKVPDFYSDVLRISDDGLDLVPLLSGLAQVDIVDLDTLQVIDKVLISVYE